MVKFYEEEKEVRRNYLITTGKKSMTMFKGLVAEKHYKRFKTTESKRILHDLIAQTILRRLHWKKDI